MKINKDDYILITNNYFKFLEALERVQSRTLRIITIPPPGTSNEIILVGVGMQRLLDKLSDITNRFKQKTQTSLNPLILELYRT